MKNRISFGAVVEWARSHDVATIYALIVLGVTIYIHTQNGHEQHRIVSDSSTNLNNLRHSPLYVLAVSAFVIPSVAGLWSLIPLLITYGVAQRWIGRVPTIVVAAIGHLLATLFVGVLISAGLTHGRLAPSIARAPDVGVSYGVAALAGLLSALIPRKWRLFYAVGLLAFFAVPMAIAPNFTDIGHLTALTTGVGVAIVALRVAQHTRKSMLDINNS